MAEKPNHNFDKSIETLQHSVTAIDGTTVPSAAEWLAVESSLGMTIPQSLRELIDNFGHGVWGRDLVFLHPRGEGSQGLRQANLVQVKTFTDPHFQTLMPGNDPRNWSVLPVSLLPYRTHIFLSLDSGEVIIYDGDYCRDFRTGVVGLADFIAESLRWHEVDLPDDWKDFAEANWPSDLPIFSANCEHRPDGFYAL